MGGALAAPVGPPGGSVGNLMVGAAEGFGGRLMRTVSFLGWTLPVSFFGGTAPPGAPGMLGGMSAIMFALKINRRRGLSNSYSKEKRRVGVNRQTGREKRKRGPYGCARRSPR
jgi:hypothetical protein